MMRTVKNFIILRVANCFHNMVILMSKSIIIHYIATFIKFREN